MRDQVAALGAEVQQRQSEKETMAAQRDDLNTQLQVDPGHQHPHIGPPKTLQTVSLQGLIGHFACLGRVGWGRERKLFSQYIMFPPPPLSPAFCKICEMASFRTYVAKVSSSSKGLHIGASLPLRPSP